LRTEAGGGDCWWRVVEAAAAVNPRDRRAEGKRRSVEENSLKVVVGRRGEGVKMSETVIFNRVWWGLDDEIRTIRTVLRPSAKMVQINHLPASRPLAF
jgi:hypothetical protein